MVPLNLNLSPAAIDQIHHLVIPATQGQLRALCSAYFVFCLEILTKIANAVDSESSTRMLSPIPAVPILGI